MIAVNDKTEVIGARVQTAGNDDLKPGLEFHFVYRKPFHADERNHQTSASKRSEGTEDARDGHSVNSVED